MLYSVFQASAYYRCFLCFIHALTGCLNTNVHTNVHTYVHTSVLRTLCIPLPFQHKSTLCVYDNNNVIIIYTRRISYLICDTL